MIRPLVASLLVAVIGGCAASDGESWPGNPFQAFSIGVSDDGALVCYTSAPSVGAEGFTSSGGPAGNCAPMTGDDPCEACAKAECCEVSQGCFTDQSCTCNVKARTKGTSAEQCGDVDATYTAVAACIDTHCAEHCPALQ